MLPKLFFPYLQRIALVSYCLLECLNVFLLIVDLLHSLAEVGLKLVMGVIGLCDPLLEGHVSVVPVAPHLVGALGDQIVHLAPQALGRRPGR